MMKRLLLTAALFANVSLLAVETTQNLAQVAKEGYTYGYPLVLMDVTKQVFTNVPAVTEAKAPINQFLNKKEFPNPSFTDVVSPNADTLYSSAIVDVTKEPVILSVPEIKDRYYLMEILDAWTDVIASPGTRTNKGEKRDYAMIGPAWKGTLPQGVAEIRSPSNFLWVLGRTETRGEKDYEAVHKIQDQYKLTPLSAWGTDYQVPKNLPVNPTWDMKTPPVQQVAAMQPENFFNRLNYLLNNEARPLVTDKEMLTKLAAIGIRPGQVYDTKSFTPQQLQEIAQGVETARKEIVQSWNTHADAKIVNGWAILSDLIGNYGNNYALRATIAYGGLGANLPQDAIYPAANTDSSGQPLSGKNKYVIHFNEKPPVHAFWSITLYNDKQFFVKNPINRYAIGDRSSLVTNPDGSFDIYIQNESPGKEKEANWLPAPEGSFNLLMRLYYPSEAILNGTWKPPIIQKQ